MEPSAAEWLAEGDAHYDARRWNEAGEAIERALAAAPADLSSNARAWYRLGNVREEQGRDEDAVGCFLKALALDPTHAQSWNNLGGAHQRLGRLDPAADAFRKAIAADPMLPQPYLNLGRLHGARGEQSLAAACFEAGLARHPGDPTFAHLVAAARGENSERAPVGYVTHLFDGIAAGFERHLVQDLGYKVPEALAALALPALRAVAASRGPARALDLGCGTGLVGAALASAGVELTGIDVSERMLEVAGARGLYARLEKSDLVEAMAREREGSFDAVFSADVFIYIGDLSAVFPAVARVLAPGGVFAFSVEALESGSYRLQPTGRYAQSPAYLRELAARAGLEERRIERTPIRREGRAYAEGWLALFARPGRR